MILLFYYQLITFYHVVSRGRNRNLSTPTYSTHTTLCTVLRHISFHFQPANPPKVYNMSSSTSEHHQITTSPQQV